MTDKAVTLKEGLDGSFGGGATLLRAPDVRISHVDTEILCDHPPFSHVVHVKGRSLLAYPLQGAFELEIDGTAIRRHIPQGTAVGIEDGRRHRWYALAGDGDRPSELLLTSIPRKVSLLQRLNDGIIIVPPDAEPYATILRRSVELHAAIARLPAVQHDEAVIRRCAEIGLIQLINFARAGIPDVPAGLARDEHLLRAWTAYFADPQRRWTVKALADAAGLGRTTFAERFRNAFGAPPLQTLTELRLEQAEAMLRDARASLIEIAFTVGYNSEAAFVRAFHRRYGMPPGRFRSINAGQGTAS